MTPDEVTLGALRAGGDGDDGGAADPLIARALRDGRRRLSERARVRTWSLLVALGCTLAAASWWDARRELRLTLDAMATARCLPGAP